MWKAHKKWREKTERKPKTAIGDWEKCGRGVENYSNGWRELKNVDREFL